MGDFIVLATVSDGRNTLTRSFTLRVVADAAANAPKILINLTPSTPTLPGQPVVATVRAQAFSPIASISVQARGTGMGLADWQDVTLDALGRLRLSPGLPGLVELRVTATDVDGFSAVQTQTLRVRDPLDTRAPQLLWAGALGVDQAGNAPAVVNAPTLLQANLQELQLMGWVLEAAPSNGGRVDESALAHGGAGRTCCAVRQRHADPRDAGPRAVGQRRLAIAPARLGPGRPHDRSDEPCARRFRCQAAGAGQPDRHRLPHRQPRPGADASTRHHRRPAG